MISNGPMKPLDFKLLLIVEEPLTPDFRASEPGASPGDFWANAVPVRATAMASIVSVLFILILLKLLYMPFEFGGAGPKKWGLDKLRTGSLRNFCRPKVCPPIAYRFAL